MFSFRPLLFSSHLITLCSIIFVLFSCHFTTIHAYMPDLLITSKNTAMTSTLLEQAILAYRIEQSGVTIQHAEVSNTEALQKIFNNEVDFVLKTTGITQDEHTAYPDVTTLPAVVGAVVPIFNLPNINSLVFSRSTMVGLFSGNITHWNDPAIQADNPTVNLPSHGIIIVLQEEPTGQTQFLSQSLSRFSNEWFQEFGERLSVDWPLHKYHAYIMATKLYGCASSVLGTPYSFSFSAVNAAVELKNTIGKMINKAGSLVECTPRSISFAATEMGANMDDLDSNPSDCAGQQGWPMIGYLYFTLPKTYTRTTCSARKALIDFISWFYSSQVVSDLAESHNLAIIPHLMQDAINLQGYMSEAFLCQGTALTVKQTNSAKLAGVRTLGVLMDLFIRYFSSSDSSYTYDFIPAIAAQSITQLFMHEVDVAMLPADSARMKVDVAELFHNVVGSGEIVMLPAFISSIMPIVNLPQAITDLYSNAAAAKKLPQIFPLILDMELLGSIFRGKIKSWTHPAIEKLNPGLTSLFTQTSSDPTITAVVCCSDSHDGRVASNPFVQALNFTKSFTENMKWDVPVRWDQVLEENNYTGFYHETTESRLPTTVARIPGAIGYKIIDSTVVNPYTDTRLINYAADGSTTVVSANVDSALACAESVTPDTTFFSLEPRQRTSTHDFLPAGTDLSTVTSPRCWPIVSANSFMIKRQVRSDYCDRANHSLTMMQWMLLEPSLTEPSHQRATARAMEVPAVRQLVIEELHKITCNGETILITLPIIWKLTTGIQIFAFVMSVIGIVIMLAALVVLWLYKQKAIMRAASVPFMILMLMGLIFMFSATILYVTTPTTAVCGTMLWLINTGFSLTFAPLFVKMWRIWKIFGRKQLKVTKLSNSKLSAIVGVIVLCETGILSIWQGKSPLQPMLQSRFESGRSHEYTTCYTDSEGVPFLVILSISKAIMLLFGAVMGFSTRKVASAFNESNQVAWAIYNVLFSSLIIIPIMIWINAIGDTMVLLLVFLILWISFCTFGFVFVPKFYLLTQSEEKATMSSINSNREMSNGFSFVSIAALTRDTIDRYITALQNQLIAAKSRRTQLFNEQTPGVSIMKNSMNYGAGGSRMFHLPGTTSGETSPNNRSRANKMVEPSTPSTRSKKAPTVTSPTGKQTVEAPSLILNAPAITGITSPTTAGSPHSFSLARTMHNDSNHTASVPEKKYAPSSRASLLRNINNASTATDVVEISNVKSSKQSILSPSSSTVTIGTATLLSSPPQTTSPK